MGKRRESGARALRLSAEATVHDVQQEERVPLTAISGEATTPLSLDRLIHERVRLAIVSALAVHDALSFNELRALLETSDGNVSVHARKLEDAGYITCTKGFEGRIPRTEYRLAPDGRRALEQYLSHMEALIRRVGGQ